MQKMKVTITGLLALAVLAGCSNDENLPGGNDNNGRVALQVTSGIQTRAYDDRWEANDAIGVFALMPGTTEIATDETSGTAQGNRQYSTLENALGTFNPADENATIYLPVDGSTRDFTAYYPYKPEMAGSTYKIDLSNQAEQKNIDFMVSTTQQAEGSSKTKGISKTDPSVQFRFEHKLSKVRLNIETGNGFAGNYSELAGMTVALTGQQTTADFDVLTDDKVAIAKGYEGIDLLTAENGRTSEGIVMPSNDYDGMQFEFHVKGHEQPYVWELNNSEKATRFDPGKEYIYNITIHKTAIEITATIKDWEQGNADGESGSAE
ncbi:fimbrillin family protein [Bacteroides gallinarum]|uniref:fimbrillin family protein n=1 Tax=Bacteroides gallinarum TaxID=376806 RepID=UPI00035EE35D|nr:fimbrillin family protein [Bacteroides gallinarum]